MAINKNCQTGLLMSFAWLVSALPSQAATYTVNTTQDPGPAGTLSLRQAIAQASIADTITFDSSLSGKTCVVKSPLSVFVQNLNITAAGLPENVIVSGGGKVGPVFSTGQNLTLTNLTITGGHDTGSSAGGIANGQYLNLTNCKVIDNTSANGTGGILSSGPSALSLSLNGCTISNNSGGNQGAISSVGPAQMNYQSALSMNNCTVSGNSSTSGDAGVTVAGVNSPATFTSCTFTNNKAATNRCGGIAVGGVLTATNCTFKTNTGTAVVHSSNGEGYMTLTGCVIHGNNVNSAAPNGGSVVIEESDSGSVRGNGTITISNCQITGNTGGGIAEICFSNEVSSEILNVSGTTITGNSLGAMINTLGTLNLSNSTVSGNGCYTGLGTVVNDMGTLTVTNSSISNNTNVGLGAIYSYAQTAPNQANVTVKYSTISGNASTSGNGGGVVSVNQGPGANATINTSTIYDNVSNSTSGTGGGVHFDAGSSASTLTLIGATITKNSAHSGGGVYVVAVPTATVSVDSTIIAGNTASDNATPDISGTVVSKGYNLIGVVDGSAGWVSTDQTGDEEDPLMAKLAALANNGGPTKTCALLAGSPALNKGDPALKGTQDQRGVTRPATPAVGAYQ